MNVGKILSAFAFCADDQMLSLLMKFRKVSRVWERHIESLVPRINTFTKVYRVCLESLYYDKSVYDQHYYERKLLGELSEKYDEVSLPVINMDELQLDDEIILQYMVGRMAMPDEYHVFMRVYREYPSSIIRPVPIDVLIGVLESQLRVVSDLVMSAIDDASVSNLVTYCPICYSIDKDNFASETKLMHVLCYVNVVDKNLEIDFPIDSERFCIIDIPVVSLSVLTIDLGFIEKADKTVAKICVSKSDITLRHGDIIDVVHTINNDGKHEIYAHDIDNNQFHIRGNTIVNEKTKGAIISGDCVKLTFRAFELEILSKCAKIKSSSETAYLPKNIASELCGFAKLFQRM